MKRPKRAKVAKYLNYSQNLCFLPAVWGVKVYDQEI